MYEGVAILGAGLSGLGCALRLPGARIYEAKSHGGGHAFSHPLDGVHFDEGAHICHSKNKRFLDLILRQLDAVSEIDQSVVSNFWKGTWLTYPVQNHLRQLPEKLRVPALTDLVMAQVEQYTESPQNYYDWCTRQYGETLTESFYRVFTNKYWRTDMENLSTDWLGGRLIQSVIPSIIQGAFCEREEDQAKFASFRYPKKGGFFAFFEPLYDTIEANYNEKVIEVDPSRKEMVFESGRKESYDTLASSIPLPILVRAIKDAPSRITDLVDKLYHTKSVLVNVILNTTCKRNEHWFYVYDEDIEASRVSIPSNISPDCVSDGQCCFQSEIFRRNDEIWNIDQIQENTNSKMMDLIGYCESDVSSMNVVKTPYSYIVSDLNRESIVAEILEWLESQRIFSMGLYGQWKYMWSDVAFLSGEGTALAIEKEIKKNS